jgi:hypothetical protein
MHVVVIAIPILDTMKNEQGSLWIKAALNAMKMY